MGLFGFNRRRRKQAKKEINYEEKVEKYHTGRGWYKLPNVEQSLRKDKAIELLKEGG